MEIQLNCSECDDHVIFEPSRSGSRGGRLVGRCAGCSSVFSLFGGRLSPIDVIAPERAVTRAGRRPRPISGGSLSMSAS